MAKQTLPVNFKDDILASSMGGKRRYILTDNGDGTYSLDDATDYTQTGSDFGAGQMNATNQAVNESCDKADVIDDLDDIVANQANGMIAGAKAVAELNVNLDTNITTSEAETHELYENQRIYIKYVDCKALPNAGNKVYNLDIPSGFAWIDLSNSYVYSNVPRLRTIFPMNYHNEKTGSSITFSLSENDKTITFGTADDWSAYNAFVVVKYYKY